MATITLPVPGAVEADLSSGLPVRFKLRRVEVDAIGPTGQQHTLDKVALSFHRGGHGPEPAVEVELAPREAIRVFNALAAHFGLPAYME